MAPLGGRAGLQGRRRRSAITPKSASRNGYGSAALPADAETVALQRKLPGHSGGITHIHAGRPLLPRRDSGPKCRSGARNFRECSPTSCRHPRATGEPSGTCPGTVGSRTEGSLPGGPDHASRLTCSKPKCHACPFGARCLTQTSRDSAAVRKVARRKRTSPFRRVFHE